MDSPDTGTRRQRPKAGLVAAGGIAGAIGATSCCVVPLLMFSVGISGAWIGTLTALEPFRPVFILVTLGLLGYGAWLVYGKPRACAEGAACARPIPGRLVRGALWLSFALVTVALFWDFIAPVVAPVLLGL